MLKIFILQKIEPQDVANPVIRSSSFAPKGSLFKQVVNIIGNFFYVFVSDKAVVLASRDVSN